MDCRHLSKKDAANGLAYCRFHKTSIVIPGTCNRCKDYIAVNDRRAGKERRDTE